MPLNNRKNKRENMKIDRTTKKFKYVIFRNPQGYRSNYVFLFPSKRIKAISVDYVIKRVNKYPREKGNKIQEKFTKA
jgi:hypothetical protein